MSLEAKIEELTVQVAKLVAVMSAVQPVQTAEEPAKKEAKPAGKKSARVTPIKEDDDESVLEDGEAPTMQDVLNVLSKYQEKLGREDTKVLLAAYNAKKIGDVKPADYENLMIAAQSGIDNAE